MNTTIISIYRKCLFWLLLTSLFGYSMNFYSLQSNWTISDMIYAQYQIDDDSLLSFCISRFNSTHQFGCSNAQPSTQHGVPFFVDNSSSLDQIPEQLRKSSKAFTLIINVYDFESILKFRAIWNTLVDHLSGVIFYRPNEEDLPSVDKFKSFSHDSECPNSNFGSSGEAIALLQCESSWVSSDNPFIDFALTKWPFPMFYAQNKTLIDQLRDCASDKWASQGTECFVSLKLFMHGAINSVQCLKRNNPFMDQLMYRFTSLCHTITAKNIIAPLVPISANSTTVGRSSIVLTARMDALTAFASFSPGANSVYSGLIVLVTTAYLLNKQRDQISNNLNGDLKNVLFALFDGESLGYAGSSSWLYYNNYVPQDNSSSSNDFRTSFLLNKTAYVIELNQLITKTNTFWIHSGDQSDTNTAQFVDKLIELDGAKFVKASSKEFPPSTVRIFKILDPDISAILIAGYDSQFSDPFFHSIFDYKPQDTDDELVTKLSNLAVTLAKLLYFQMTKQEGQIEPELDFVSNLTLCFFQKVSNCRLFEGNLVLKNVPFTFTTPVRSSSLRFLDTMVTKQNTLTLRSAEVRNAIFRIVAHATGKIFNCSISDTPYKGYPGINWIQIEANNQTESKNKCVFSQTTIDEMSSPYFDYTVDGHEEVGKWINSRKDFQFSSVAESNYDTNEQPAIIIFVRPSKLYQLEVLLLGVLITVMSFTLANFINKHSDQLFTPRDKQTNSANISVNPNGKTVKRTLRNNVSPNTTTAANSV